MVKRIGYVYGTRKGIGAHTFIDHAWKKAIENLGFEYSGFSVDSSLVDWQKLLVAPPDLLIVQNFPRGNEYFEIFSEARRLGVYILHVVDKNKLDHLHDNLCNYAYADKFFGEIEPSGLGQITKKIGHLGYYKIPCAADGSIHYPYDLMETNVDYDAVFLGSKRTSKPFAFEKIMNAIEMDGSYKTLFSGPFWTKSDFLMYAAQRLLHRLRLQTFSNSIGSARLKIPMEKESELYSRSLVSLNFHERHSLSEQDHLIVNGRTFKVAASGGVLLTDHVTAMDQYFEEGADFISFKSADEFWDRFSELRNNKPLRIKLRKSASARAQGEHLQEHRLSELISMIKNNSGKYIQSVNL